MHLCNPPSLRARQENRPARRGLRCRRPCPAALHGAVQLPLTRSEELGVLLSLRIVQEIQRDQDRCLCPEGDWSSRRKTTLTFICICRPSLWQCGKSLLVGLLAMNVNAGYLSSRETQVLGHLDQPEQPDAKTPSRQTTCTMTALPCSGASQCQCSTTRAVRGQAFSKKALEKQQSS